MLSWMPYAMIVGLLVTGVAVLVQPLGRPWRGSARWWWMAALVSSLLLPVGLPLVTAPAAGVGGATLGEGSVALAAAGSAEFARPVAAWRSRLDTALGWGWVLASALLIGQMTASAHRLGRRVQRWPRRRIDGVLVRVGPLAGPAVVGLREPEIVVPEWVVELPPRDRRLILAHETQHLVARDPALMLIAWLLAALIPWSPASWFQLRRLRAAVEEDCDHRVVRRRPRAEVRRYAELLLDAGRRVAPGASFAPASFAEAGTPLESRIRAMFDLFPPLSRLRAVLAVGGALGLAALVYLLPGPERSPLAPPPPEPPPVPALAEARDPIAEPSFTPFTRAPELLNRAEVGRLLQSTYPDELREAGIGGTARLWFHVDNDGALLATRVASSSGHERLDQAALEVARQMEFSPAVNRDQVVTVWIQFPIVFQTTS